MTECERLLQTGYSKAGNWSLGQICYHMRVTIDANMHGYPAWMTVIGYSLRPALRMFALPRLLAGKSPKGVPTAGMFVPPNDLNDDREMQLFSQCISQFLASETSMHPHPGFGKMSKREFHQFHAAHAAHHLSFLKANESSE